MKKYLLPILALALVFCLFACKASESGTVESGEDKTQTHQQATEPEKEDDSMIINVTVNGVRFTATLEDNTSAKEFYEMIENGGVSVNMSDYSGFEKVGPLGRTLTADDKRVTAKRGDIVLYNSSQIVMFYGSNSWSYTRLGKIDDLSGWEDALGSGDITAEFSVNQ